ncbi:uncharacterized protein LOC114520986 [Dendronephthya gigantea]|uniref:uncharacterized protein LOC114520986 n=1 Tax=Dendronephthya gigantea TaxID=151771 RepID=UPI00106A757C|nr:uncharacterized protein LOC114520986 [Dendronephthya gigantea]
MASSLGSDKKGKQLIVVSLPENAYYRKSLKDIESFIRDMSERSTGLDDVLVVYSNALEKGYKTNSTLPLAANTRCLLVDESLDLWMRDFCPVLPKYQVKFSYRPKYLKSKDAKFVESEFMKVLGRNMDISLKSSDIVLDGGNVVDNNSNKVIISERIFVENKGKSRHVLQQEIENLLAAKVAFIPDPEDTTGHADGIVAFIEENVLAIADFGDEDEYYRDVEVAVKSAFPNVETFRVPCGKQDSGSVDKKWKGFTDATGSYVNMLVTNNAIYVPQYGQTNYDKQALEIVRSHTSKTVVPVSTKMLSHMGGSVRCMSWQMESSHPVAQALYKNSTIGKGS